MQNCFHKIYLFFDERFLFQNNSGETGKNITPLVPTVKDMSKYVVDATEHEVGRLAQAVESTFPKNIAKKAIEKKFFDMIDDLSKDPRPSWFKMAQFILEYKVGPLTVGTQIYTRSDSVDFDGTLSDMQGNKDLICFYDNKKDLKTAGIKYIGRLDFSSPSVRTGTKELPPSLVFAVDENYRVIAVAVESTGS